MRYNQKDQDIMRQIDQIRLFLAKKQGAEVAAAADSNNSNNKSSKSENNSATMLYNNSLGTTSLNRLAKPNVCRATGGKVENVKPTTIGQNGET